MASTRDGAQRSPTPVTVDDIDPSVLGEWDVHEAAAMWPLIDPAELAAMAEDIRRNGQQEPVWTYQGQVLDGRNRLVACRAAGVAPRFQEWEPRGADDTPTTFIMSRNMHRRHLSASQRAAVAVRLEGVIAAESQRRRDEHRRAQAVRSPFGPPSAPPVGLPRTPGTSLRFLSGDEGNESTAVPPPSRRTTTATPPGAPLQSPFGDADVEGPGDSAPSGDTQPSEQHAPAARQSDVGTGSRLRLGRARTAAAEAMNVSSGYVNDAKDLSQSYPEEFREVMEGTLTLPQAQEKVVEKARADGRVDEVRLRPGAVKDAAARLDRRATREGRSTKPRISLPKFSRVSSSRTTVTITATFGNPEVAEQLLNQMQDDPKVLDLAFEVAQPASTRRRR